MSIDRHKVVYLDYVLKDAEGQVLEESTDDEPLVYIHGLEQIVPGLEKHLTGLEIGAKRDVVVSPEEGFGTHDPEGVFSLPRDAFPADLPLEPGDILPGEADDGEPVYVRIIEIKDDEVKVDANHPLAGQTLHYSVTVRNIRDATPEEIEHEHAHDAGHDHDDEDEEEEE